MQLHYPLEFSNFIFANIIINNDKTKYIHPSKKLQTAKNAKIMTK